MEMDAHVCKKCGHLWAMHSGYSDTNLCRSPGCCCERSCLNAEKHNNEDAREHLADKDATIADLAAKLKRAVEVVKGCEWAGDGDRCTFCTASAHDPHDPDCKYAAVLKENA